MGSLWSLKGMFVLMFWQIKISISSKILHLRVGCHIHEGVFSPKGEEEEEERIKDISFLSFHAHVRSLGVLGGRKMGSVQEAGLLEYFAPFLYGGSSMGLWNEPTHLYET